MTSFFHCVIYWLTVYKLFKADNLSVFQFPNMGNSCFKRFASDLYVPVYVP